MGSFYGCLADSQQQYKKSLMNPINIGIFGCTGRVGRRLCVLTEEHPELTLSVALCHELVGKPLYEVESQIPKSCSLVVVSPTDLGKLAVKPDVIVDFSAPAGTVTCVRQAATLGIPMVIGTTGLNPDQEAVIRTASQKIPIIHAMNFSLGVNLLVQVASTVAAALGEDFNIEIVEAHHNKKVDAPSGTALALADSVCQALGRSREDLVQGREGIVGKRSTREIGVHALRMGSVVGDHTVHFGSEFERIELTHRAQNRDVFASGALRAARWLANKPPGMYTMADVLFNQSEKSEN
ncbi:4-hydroxy-tetrahydrodipicolinate reductase-like [Condylostylus longicornis]|uniref:4-hydroxy-tetrahydrodipicolinate reductase-like n=1 Tax=Condylostylus longicornis TaxID=2530218 RepID=UPI00244E28C5|nr:4-hydroxy-tetrahydrodipicolinate reductase-like [Condylostylus longicornis]